MAIKIKSADVIANKFATRGAAAAGDYAQGVQNPRRDWQSSTASAEASYNQGVQDAIGRGSFKKGVNAAGNDKYQRKAAGVGAQRFAPGISAAKGDYQAGVQPYLDTIANLTLPPRQPKGSPANVARVSAVADALRAKKLAS
jgi:hypothetical protein